MKKAFGFFLFILSILFGCTKDDSSSDNDFTTENTELQNDTLIIYQKENITIELIEINEGRCPITVDCAWQGNTTVEMNISNGIEDTNFILNSAGFINDDFNFQNSIIIYDLHIELLDLQPYPEDENTEFPLEDYIVKLSVN